MPYLIDRNQTIAAGERLDLTNEHIEFVLDERPGSPGFLLENFGRITVLSGGLDVFGVVVPGWSWVEAPSVFWNRPSGVLTVVNEAVPVPELQYNYQTFGVTINNTHDRLAVRNDGLIEVFGPGRTYGAGLSSGRLENSGQIISHSGLIAYGVRTSIGRVENSGLIEARGDLVSIGMELSFPYLTNTGIIRAVRAEGSPYASIGLLGGGGPYPGDAFTNDGLIEGDYALFVESNDAFADPRGGMTIVNNGEFRGAVNLGYDHSLLVNNGVITDVVILHGGEDVYDGRGSQAGGIVDGGFTPID